MTANDVGFLASAGFVILTTIAVALLMNLAFKVRKFELAQALRLKKGLYQHKETGRLIEVKSLKGSTLYAVDETGGYNMHAKTLDDNYSFVGEL